MRAFAGVVSVGNAFVRAARPKGIERGRGGHEFGETARSRRFRQAQKFIRSFNSLKWQHVPGHPKVHSL